MLGEEELLSVCTEDRNVHMDQLLVLTPVAGWLLQCDVPREWELSFE